MADQQVNLSDAELQEAVKAGWFQENPALLNKLDSDSRRRFVRVNAETNKGATMGPEPGWAAKYPTTAGVTRGALGTLPTVGGMVGGLMGAPEGVIGALPGMALGAGAGRGAQDLLMEALGLSKPTSPMDKAKGIAGETAIGAAGPIAVEGGLAALRGAGGLVKQGLLRAATASDAVDSDLVGMVSPKWGRRIESAQKVKAKWGGSAESAPAPPAASAPTAPEVAPSPAPAPASAAPTRAPRARTGRGSASASQTSEGFSLSPEETTQAERWMAKGVPPEEILNRILMSRKLTKATGAPTPQEMRNAVDQRNATGRWPDEP
jgi:hypothetical protein